MPAHCFATRAGFTRRRIRSVRALARLTTPPVAIRPVERRTTIARVSGFDSLLRTRSPFYGLSCDAPRSSTPMRTDRFLLPTASTTSTRAPSVPGISSKLALRPSPLGLHPSRGDRRTWRFTTPDPLQRAARVGARRASSAYSRTSRASDTPVASPIRLRCAFARAGLLGAA